MNTRIVVALFAEAKPLIEKLGLGEIDGHAPFRLFKRDTTVLIVSGMGKAAVASACGYLHALSASTGVWINIGIAGHRSAPIGHLFLANKILDINSEQVWYPPQIISTTITTQALHTVNTEEKIYPEDVGYDMEGAAFYASASRFDTSELVQCLKIVSDNVDSSTTELNKGRVEALIRNCVMDILNVIEQLQALACTLPKPIEIKMGSYLDQWHFSHAQRQQLRSLLERLAVIGATPTHPDNLADSRAVIQHLQSQLLHTPVHFA